MTTDKRQAEPREPNAVEDVRRVREQLSESFGGDLRRLAEHAEQVAERYRASLGLRTPVSPTLSSRPVP